MSRTLLIVKPDATKRNLIGHIVSRLEKAKFKIVEMKMLKLKKSQSREFYAVQQGKHFLDALFKFMCFGSSVSLALEKEKAS